jgi:Fe-S-cluster containining protein
MKQKYLDNIQDTLCDQYIDVAEGLRYIHTRVNANTTKTLEATSFLYALIELLNEKELLSIEELDERKKQVAERLVRKFTESGIGLVYQDPEYDKYTFEHEAQIDCQSRLHICKAICCKFPFALSRQDVEECIIRWEFGRPYLIAHNADDYCVHLDRNTYQCTVREHRPVPCKGFNCQDNERWRVWLDYEKKIINGELIEQINQGNGKYYTY